MGAIDMARADMAWGIYAEDHGSEGARGWTIEEREEYARAEIEAADEIGEYDGISEEMEIYARG